MRFTAAVSVLALLAAPAVSGSFPVQDSSDVFARTFDKAEGLARRADFDTVFDSRDVAAIQQMNTAQKRHLKAVLMNKMRTLPQPQANAGQVARASGAKPVGGGGGAGKGKGLGGALAGGGAAAGTGALLGNDKKHNKTDGHHHRNGTDHKGLFGLFGLAARAAPAPPPLPLGDGNNPLFNGTLKGKLNSTIQGLGGDLNSTIQGLEGGLGGLGQTLKDKIGNFTLYSLIGGKHRGNRTHNRNGTSLKDKLEDKFKNFPRDDDEELQRRSDMLMDLNRRVVELEAEALARRSFDSDFSEPIAIGEINGHPIDQRAVADPTRPIAIGEVNGQPIDPSLPNHFVPGQSQQGSGGQQVRPQPQARNVHDDIASIRPITEGTQFRPLDNVAALAARGVDMELLGRVMDAARRLDAME